MSAFPDDPRKDAPDPTPVAVQVQILATEHWNLLATRSMIWNEMFSRTGMFLTTLSAAAVALALVAQATSFGQDFQLFAVLVLPIVLLLGAGTYIRLIAVLEEDMWLVIGMNRLRRAYVDLAPHLEVHFVTSAHDDVAGFLQSYGGYGRPIQMRASPGGIVSSTGAIVGILDCVLFAIVVALLLNIAGAGSVTYILMGVVAGIAAAVVLIGVVPYRKVAGAAKEYEPRFPRDAAEPTDRNAGSVS